jgi:chromosome segregation protein
VRSAADEAAAQLTAAMERAEEAAVALTEAAEAQEAAQATIDDMRRQMQMVDAAAAEISGRLGRLAGAARAAIDEANRLDASVGAAQRSADKDLTKLAQLKSELAEAKADEARASDPDLANEQAEEERSELALRATAARNSEMEARLEVRTVEERLRAISGRADSLASAAAAERTARERAAARRRERAAQASVAKAVASGARVAVSAAESSLTAALARRETTQAASAAGAGALKAVRAQVTALSTDLDKVVNTAHGTEIARAEHRLRLEQMESHAVEEYGVEPSVLVTEYGPDVLVPTAVVAPTTEVPDASGAVGDSAEEGDSRSSESPEDQGEPGDSGDDRDGDAARPEASPVPAVPSPSAAPAPSAMASVEPAPPAAPAPAAAPAPGGLFEALRAVTEAARAEQAGPGESPDGGTWPGADGSGSPAGGAGRGPRRKRAVAVQEVPAAVPYVREEQERRAAEAEKQLTRLGKINPLALEEFAALQERHQFLATQLEDLRKTRRDLLTVVKEVDDRVQEVFASAYADVEREFSELFGRLFPGGSGRLVLTEPEDMLTTGIEIEASPPGKKVKRLSLLSGGERSLTAIAYLFAIFKARPSPFYVLDEVEAALDDSNLQRLLRAFEELRESSQLIVITHQRRTMEAADALYGVSMRGDGVSTVISQRVRESEPA